MYRKHRAQYKESFIKYTQKNKNVNRVNNKRILQIKSDFLYLPFCLGTISVMFKTYIAADGKTLIEISSSAV